MTPLNIQLSPTAKATYVQAEHVCGYVRITGWIKAESTESGLEAGALIGGLFGRKSSGGFSTDGQFIDFPFSFDVSPEYDSKRGQMEDKGQHLSRIENTLSNAQRNLSRARNHTNISLAFGPALKP